MGPSNERRDFERIEMSLDLCILSEWNNKSSSSSDIWVQGFPLQVS